MTESQPSTAVGYYALYVVFRRKVLISTSFLVLFASMLFFVWLITPTYTASSKVLVHNNYRQQLSLSEEVTSPGQRNQRFNWALNLVELAKSARLARAMVEEFNLARRLYKKAEHPANAREEIKAFLSNLIAWPSDKLEELGLIDKQPKDWFAKAIEKFQEDMLEAEALEDTEVIKLGVNAESPELANQMIEALTQRLLSAATAWDRTAAEQAYDHASEQVQRVAQKYESARAKLERFKLKWKVTSFEDEKRLELEHIKDIEQKLSDANFAWAEVRSEIKEVKRQMAAQKRGPQELQELSERLRELRQKRAGLEARKDSLVKARVNKREAIQQLLTRENDYLRLKDRVTRLEEMYHNLQKKRDELLMQSNTEIGEFSLRRVGQAHVSPYADPDWPNLKLLLPVLLLFSVIVPLALAFLIEYFLHFPRTADELAHATHTQVLSVIPHIGTVGRKP